MRQKSMNKTVFSVLVLAFFYGHMNTVSAALPVDRVLPTGGGYSVSCQGFGVEMRGNNVKSCFLAVPGDFPSSTQKRVSCAAKYAVAFRSDGRMEYCTLGADTTFDRTPQHPVSCKSGGRVVVRTDGTVESALLKDTVELPYAKGKTVACRGGSPVTFRADGNVETCVLDRESVFAASEKKNLEKTCLVGGLIAFDEDGKFSGCYPPAPPKGSVLQGGQKP